MPTQLAYLLFKMLHQTLNRVYVLLQGFIKFPVDTYYRGCIQVYYTPALVIQMELVIRR